MFGDPVVVSHALLDDVVDFLVGDDPEDAADYRGLFHYDKHPVHIPSMTTYNLLIQFAPETKPVEVDTRIVVALIANYRQAIEIG